MEIHTIGNEKNRVDQPRARPSGHEGTRTEMMIKNEKKKKKKTEKGGRPYSVLSFSSFDFFLARQC